MPDQPPLPDLASAERTWLAGCASQLYAYLQRLQAAHRTLGMDTTRVDQAVWQAGDLNRYFNPMDMTHGRPMETDDHGAVNGLPGPG